MRLPAMLASLVLLSGCVSMPDYMAQPEEYESHGSTIHRVNGHHMTDLQYKPASLLQKEEEHKAAHRRSEPELRGIPAGGMLFLRYYAGTIGSADPEYWEIIVEDTEGNEITRRRGDPGTPDYTVLHGHTLWHDSIVAALPDKMTEPFNVFVYDEISGFSSEFLIIPGQE